MLDYYMTFNRSQGQSVEQHGLFLPQSLFTCGQLYVGLSRYRNPKKSLCVWKSRLILGIGCWFGS